MLSTLKFIIPLISFIFHTLLFPVKFCLQEYPSENTDRDFVVVRFDSTKNWWILTGDKNGLKDFNKVPDIPVEIEGKNIEEIVSGDLYINFEPTYFVLWGDIEKKEVRDIVDGREIASKQLTIDCTDWDILYEVSSRNEFRAKFPRKYLTIYDFKWFDKFRFWNYDEYYY